MSYKSLHQLYIEHAGKVSDKWSLYLAEYDRLFRSRRDDAVRILEIGIQNGGSLEIWSKYFSHATIITGCDVNPDCSYLSFEDSRIGIVVGDANASDVSDRILQRSPQLDIVIDDGSHRSSDIIKSFALYFPRITDGGLFIAEDLHCSYWSDFEGGLFEPYSSISFFKRLADVINHEHWGVKKERADILRGAFEKYGCEVDADTLSRVHSVEFVNSMCIVRKAPPADNCLGHRIIAGSVERVVQGHRALHNKPYGLEPIYDQSSNRWANRDIPPDEEMQHLEPAFVAVKRQLAYLEQALEERDEQVAAANQAAAEYARRLQDLYSSNSWRITKPLRGISIAIARSRSLASRVAPSRLKRLAQLVRPHMAAIYQDPGLFRMKAQAIWLGWKAGGTREVVRRLQQSYAIRNGTLVGTVDGEVERHMRELIALPTQPISSAALPNHREVAIIVPVYRGVSETRRCIESVIKSSNNSTYRLIIINDASPEPEVEDYLNSIAGTSPHIEVLNNQENLGFVETVNRGMRLAGAADVVLLNSDTAVANDWLDRMVAQAYADERIGTVTPFSNNATICSYPDLDGWSSLPLGETVERLDTCFAAANPGCAVELPTAVGFCMYIKGACLQEVGLFDTETFGKGYGEENDFCLRATKNGWRHLLAADVFVFHEGEVSFSESATAKKANAMKILRKLYPDYEASVATHIATNAAHIYRLRATAARYRSDNRHVVLFITHSYGGGTEKHVQELAQKLTADNHRVLYLRSRPGSEGYDLTLESHEECDRLFLRLVSRDFVMLVDILKAFGVSSVHIHHTLGFSFDVESLTTLMGVNYNVTVHDFYTICPRINLYTRENGYCGNPSIEDCNSCLRRAPNLGTELEIVWWRAKSASLLNGADNVYCPSKDTAARILKFFPVANVSVVPHEEIALPPTRHSTAKRSVRRYALLGVLAEHKGLSFVQAILNIAEHQNLAIEFVLIGSAERPLNSRKFSQTGPYNDCDLQRLIDEVDPDALLFPAQWPETYSYTLSAAIRSGRPIIVADLGALPERVRDLDRGYIYPHTLTPLQLAEYLASLRVEFEKDRATLA